MSPRRRRSALEIYQAHFGPNMTPMVDVVMVILVFFMASAVVLGPDWFIRAALPIRATTAPASHDSLVRVELALKAGDESEGGTRVSALYLGSVPGDTRLPPPPTGLPLDGLGAWLGELARGVGPDRLVVAITPAPNVPYQDVVSAHEACAAAGIERTGIAASQRPAPQP